MQGLIEVNNKKMAEGKRNYQRGGTIGPKRGEAGALKGQLGRLMLTKAFKPFKTKENTN